MILLSILRGAMLDLGGQRPLLNALSLMLS